MKILSPFTVSIFYFTYGKIHFFKKPFDEISSFSLENYLQVLKRFAQKSQNPLSQIVKQVAELEEHALSGWYHKVIHTKYSVNAWLAQKMLGFC